MTAIGHEFYRLAELHGLQLSYWDIGGQQHIASPESLLRMLQCLGVPIDRFEQADDLVRAATVARAQRALEPVHVVWQGSPGFVVLRLPAHVAGDAVACRLTIEGGVEHVWNLTADQWSGAPRQQVDGYSYAEVRLPIPVPLPIGYHRLDVEVGGLVASTLVLAAPPVAHARTTGGERQWGVFLPLYALHSRSSWGAGDFADLAVLSDWVADQGGSLVATLPLLASFHEREGDDSPYRPASRLFWNEFYLDFTRLPELGDCPAAKGALHSTEFLTEIERLRAADTVDYRRQMTLKRQVLERLACHFLDRPSSRREDFEHYMRRNPEVDAYARFRAADARHGRPWMDWPERLRAGELLPSDYEHGEYEYHRYVQWLLDEQLTELSRRAKARQLTWYLDLPLGVHPHSFDVWRYRDLFALQASGGAPPDSFFTDGQYWSFPPLHPQRLREHGYGYLASVLRAHLRYAGLLRIDHVMGLHRLFWIPQGEAPSQGVYVRYPAEELYAVVTIESQRHPARIIGENLGTVPPEVNESMDRHGIGRLYVLQYNCSPDGDRPVADVGAKTVASLNTHDMPPFAAFCRGLDIDDRLDLRLLSPSDAQAEHDRRRRTCQALTAFLRRQRFLDQTAEDMQSLLAACLAFLSESAAEYVIVNLEDLWLESAPQNTPGTSSQRVNWRRKARRAFEDIRADHRVAELLQRIDALRRR